MKKHIFVASLLCSVFLCLVMFDSAVAKSSASFTQEQRIAAHLDAIREYTPDVIMFMNKFPKGADLHNHLSGAFFVDEILVYAAKNQYLYDLQAQRVLPPDTEKTPDRISVAELLQRPVDLKAFLDIVSMRGFYENSANGSDHFFETFAHIPDDMLSYEHFARVIARNHGQGVYYVEFMNDVLPSKLYENVSAALPEAQFDLNDLQSTLAKVLPYLQSEEFATAVKDAARQRKEKTDAILQQEYGITMLGENPDIIVKFISHLYRHQTNYELFVRAVVNLMASKIDKDIVATNLVQCESHPLSLQNFDAQMTMLDFLYNKLDKPNIALHAGELSLREASLESMRERISQSIIKGHALRIGHGVSIAWEKNPQATLAMMQERGIPIEICLSSNDDILGVKGQDHPLRLYLQAGVAVTLNTDDEGVSRSNLSNEYVRAAQEHDLNYIVFKEIAKNALEYSFLEGESIYEAPKKGQKQEYILKPTYAAYISGKLMSKQPSVREVGEKAYLQIKHERDLAKFEKSFKVLLSQ